MQGQGRLTGFGFKAPSYPVRVVGMKQAAKCPLEVDPPSQLIAQPRSESITTVPESPLPMQSRVRSFSVLSDPSTDNEGATGPASASDCDVDENASEPGRPGAQNGNVIETESDMNEDKIEDWEDELEESLQGPTSHTRNWFDLREQIKDYLKKKWQNITFVSSKSAPYHLKLRHPSPQRSFPDSGKSRDCKTVA